MRKSTLKLMTLTSAIALGMGISSNSFAETQTVTTQIITNSAITLAAGDTLDFGEWALVHPAASGTNDITLTMNPLNGAVTSGGGGGLSVAVEITAGAQAGSIDVTTPAAATLDIFGSVTDNMSAADAAFALTVPTFSFDGGATTNLPAATGTSTVATSGALQTVRIGGLLTIDATPADATHTGQISVTFTY